MNKTNQRMKDEGRRMKHPNALLRAHADARLDSSLILHPSSLNSAFTLIELMISLALMVLLMLGVNFIFTAVGSATGSAQVLSKIGRDIQAAQNVMASDFSQIAMKDGPTFQITSIVRPAFMNKADQLGDGDGDPSTELLNPTDPSETPAIPAIPGNRAHRLDLLSFFARGNFHRQTGNDNEFVSDMSSNEAWIWYGHLRINGAGSFAANAQDPGTPWSTGTPVAPPGLNPDNYFASQWILGRVPMLLIDKEPDTAAGTISNGATPTQAQYFISRGWVDGVGTTNLTPLTYSAVARSGSTPYTPPVEPRFGTSFGNIPSGRFDIASTTIDQYRAHLKRMIDGVDAGSIPPFGTTDQWWGARFATDGRRFQCNPFLIKPITAAAYAQQRGVFLSGCTQFIVEYAGDFVYQDPTDGSVDGWFGDPTPGARTTDGEMDYVPAMTTAPFLPRQIRWYGMPRGTSAQNTVNAVNGDVVPLRDLIHTFPGVTLDGGAPFERHLPTSGVSTDYISSGVPLKFLENAANSANPPVVDSNYVCAWGPNDPVRPTLIRIVMVLDDPNGRLKNGMTFEYVYKVQ